LLIDNAPVHIILEETAEKLDSLKVELLPLNTTIFFSPVMQGLFIHLNVNIGLFLFRIKLKHTIICKMALQALLLLIQYAMHDPMSLYKQYETVG